MGTQRLSSEHGYTIVELVMIIVIIGILAAMVTFALPGTKTNAEDTERDSDVKTVSRHLETKYQRESTTNFPTYPGTTGVAAEVTSLQNRGLGDAAKAPNQTSSSVSAAASTADQTPSINSYVYQPFTSTGTLCTTPSSSNPCVKYRLWYRHSATSQVKVVESLRQQ